MAADKALDRNYVFSAENEANPIASLYLERKDYDRLLNIANSIKEDQRVENKGAVFMAQIYRKRGNS